LALRPRLARCYKTICAPARQQIELGAGLIVRVLNLTTNVSKLEGVDTVVLAVKNQTELTQCLEAEALGNLPPDLRARIDGLGLTNA
jgi:hypothetical protein